MIEWILIAILIAGVAVIGYKLYREMRMKKLAEQAKDEYEHRKEGE